MAAGLGAEERAAWLEPAHGYAAALAAGEPVLAAEQHMGHGVDAVVSAVERRAVWLVAECLGDAEGCLVVMPCRGDSCPGPKRPEGQG